VASRPIIAIMGLALATIARAGLVEQCAWPPPGGPAIHPESDSVEMTPIVADLDADGSPEIVIMSFVDHQDDNGGTDGILRILRGSDCSEIATNVDPGCVQCFGDAACHGLDDNGEAGVLCPSCGVAVADLDGDGFLEIAALTEGVPGPPDLRRVVIFDHLGQFVRCTEAAPVMIGAPAPPLIVDLAADGVPEVVVRDVAFSSDGPLVFAHDRTGGSTTIAADVDADGSPELFTGKTAYRADGTMLWQRADFNATWPAIADLDLDCRPELVIVHRNGQEILVLDPLTGVTRCVATLPDGGCPPRIDGQGGPPTLSDIDGDCIPEMGVAGCVRYSMFRYLAGPPEQLVMLWESPTEDQSSRFTGSAMFDLDGDGTSEVLYNDQQHFRIYDALTGVVEAEVENSSNTLVEYPTVADADGDGDAEVVVSANSHIYCCETGLRVFHDDAVPWAGVPSLFNQHSFHVTNILPDGRVPLVEEPSWARYNSYRVQGPPVRSPEGPELVGVPADVSAPCEDVPPPAEVSAVGGCGDTPIVTFEEIMSPDDCRIDRTWTARDRCGRTTSATQVISLIDDEPPTIIGPLELFYRCDEILEGYELLWVDNCDPVADAAALDGVIEEGDCPFEVKFTNTWTARDTCGNETVAIQIIHVVDDVAPQISGVPPDAIVSCEDIPLKADPSASDACDPAPVLSFVESETPGGCAAERVITRTWTAGDACGNAASLSQVITVVDDVAPQISGVPADVVVSCDDIPAPASPSASDLCDPAPGVTLVESEEPGACAGERVITRTWTAEDACGNQSVQRQVITVVDDVAPQISGVPADAVVACDEVSAPASPSASDSCDPAPVLTLVESEAPGGCAGERVITRTWTAEDACANVSSLAQVITVVDDVAPQIAGVPADVVVSCDDIPAPASPSASDLCDPAPILSYIESEAPGGCAAERVITRTWTAEDACGNVVSMAQLVTVVDDVAPALLDVPADVHVRCNEVPDPASPSAVDACDPAPAIRFAETRIEGDCPDEYVLVRTWESEDACGNVASAEQRVSVDGSGPPVIVAPPDLQVECSQVESAPVVIAVSDCDPAPVVTLAEERIDGDCPNEYQLVRTWTAIDRCGRSAEARQVVSVVDTTPPVIRGLTTACLWPPNHWMVCLAPSDFRIDVSDDCPGAVTWRFTGCHSDQPEDDLGDGHFMPDCIIGEDGSICARAERQGTVPAGRHYGVLAVAIDACGNESDETLVGNIYVPHDQSPHENCLNPTKVGIKNGPHTSQR